VADKLQLHVSGLEMLSRCGVQYHNRYILGQKIPPAVAIVKGIAVHLAVSKDLKAKIEFGNLLPEGAIRETARDSVLAQWGHGVTLDSEELEAGESKVKGAAVDTAVSLATLHHQKVAPDLKPTAVERPWVLDIEGENMQLAGTFDVQESTDSIHDTKTSGKSPSSGAADDSLQLTAYHLAAKVLDGKAPDALVLDYLVSTKVPKFVPVTTTRDATDHQMFLARLERAKQVIESGVFTPASPGSWWCSSRFCGWFQTCPFSAKPKLIAIEGAKQHEER